MPDRPLFEELVHAHHAGVYRAAMRVLGDEDAARDATQEVFLGVLGENALPADVRDAGAVLRHRAVQRALARLALDGNRRRREESIAMERPEAAQEGAAERAAERNEARDVVARLMAKLPDELRAALALRFGEDLTFAAIAELTGCSEPTAHDRVRRGLERLRGDLGRAGLAAVVPGLPTMLAQLEPPVVPAGLERTLLGLGAVAPPVMSVGAIAAWSVVSIVAAVLAGIALFPLWLDSGEGRPLAGAPLELVAVLEPPANTNVDEEHARVSLAAPPTSTATHTATIADVTQARVARVVGRLRDEQGRPITDAAIDLLADTPGLKGPFPCESTTPDADGAFEIVRELASDDPYLLRIRAPGYLEHLSARFTLELDDRRDFGELRLLPDSVELEGEFTLTIRVLDAHGVPVMDALVLLERRALRTNETEPLFWHREDSRRTDAAGVIELSGNRLGAKRAQIRPKREYSALTRPVVLGLEEPAAGSFELAIDRVGAHERTFVLERGLDLEGRIRTVDGEPLPGMLTNALVALPPDNAPWMHGRVAPDGTFRVGGLTAEPHDVRFRLQGVSPYTIVQATPTIPGDGEPLEILLKRAEDPRSIGQHDAELHGTVVDATTGEPIAVRSSDVDLETLWGEELDMSPAELEAHRREHPRSVQTRLAGKTPPPSPHFHLIGLDPGRHALWIEAPGYPRKLIAIYELKRGEMLADIEARLEPDDDAR